MHMRVDAGSSSSSNANERLGAPIAHALGIDDRRIADLDDLRDMLDCTAPSADFGVCCELGWHEIPRAAR